MQMPVCTASNLLELCLRKCLKKFAIMKDSESPTPQKNDQALSGLSLCWNDGIAGLRIVSVHMGRFLRH